MNKPLVSVIIPCFNHGKFLQETVDSVLNSDYASLEIIIVDDESTDNSLDVAQQLAEKHGNIQVFQQKNGGPSKARNLGIKEAKGQIILPLDADDLISKEYIEEAVKILTQQEDVKVVYALAKKFGAVQGEWKLKPFSSDALAKDNMIYVSALFRKTDWERVGGFSDSLELVREDWEFWIKLLKDGGNAYQMPFHGFFYRIHSNSRRKSMTKEKKRREIDYLNAHHPEFFKKHLGGKLRYQRSLSKFINLFLK